MDILRRNTDYALRLMVNLARKEPGESVSTRVLADEEDVSYQIACKLMQRLQGAGLVKSCMGPKGGFRLSRRPARVSLLYIVDAIQGRMSLNRCLLSDQACQRWTDCPIRLGLQKLQRRMEEYLGNTTLEQMSKARLQLRRTLKKGTRRK